MKLLLCALVFALPGLLRAEVPDSAATPKLTVHAVHITEPVVIDGMLNEPVWSKDDGISTFRQLDPVEGAPASQTTTVHVAYDDAAIYIGARCVDTAPDSMVVRLSRRDGNWDSDMFFCYLDPYHDQISGFYFALDAAGTLYDGTLYNDEWNDDSWNGVWEGKVHRDDHGWTAEMRIPFSQLRFQQKDQYTWGINFRRDVARRNERSYVVFTPKNGSGFVSRFPDLVGIENINAARQAEFLPYLTTRAEYSSHLPNDPFNSGSRYTPKFGGDLKMGLGPNLTLDGTVYPDFGQVEVDPAVVNLSDVETFFQEKRPFFIEGSTIFNFGSGGTNNNWGFNWPGVTFLYSRRIGRAPQGSTPNADFADVPSGTDILGAAKITGKVLESWNIGAIQAVTSREFADIQTGSVRSRAEVEPLTYYGVVRAQKEFEKGREALGFFSSLASRQFQDDRLRDQINKDGFVGGLDGWWTIDQDKTWVLGAWASVSRVDGNRARMLSLQRNSQHYFQRPDADDVSVDSNATSMTGYSARFRLNKQKGNFYLNASLGVINPKYEPNDLGFMSRSDVINGHLVMSYRWTEPRSFYRFIELGGSLFQNYDFDMNSTWRGLFHFGYIEFPNFYSLNWNTAYNPQTISTRRTRGGPAMLTPPGYQFDLYPSTDQRKSLVFSFDWFTYQAVHTRDWAFSPSVQWRPSTNISFSFSPSFEHDFEGAQYVGTFVDPAARSTFGSRYVFGEMNQNTLSAGMRLNWTFTPQMSLQVYVQPLISAAQFNRFKELAQPKTYDFNYYGENGSTIGLDDATNEYSVTPAGSSPFTFSNPDFNLKSLRGSAILRWEYLPGSTVYFVWTQSRSGMDDDGEFQFNRSIGRLFDATPDNIFLVKLSYWWNM